MGSYRRAAPQCDGAPSERLGIAIDSKNRRRERANAAKGMPQGT